MNEESKDFTISNIQEDKKDDKDYSFDNLDVSQIGYFINEEDIDNDLKELENMFDNKTGIENENKNISKLEKDLSKKEFKAQIMKKDAYASNKLKFREEKMNSLLIDLFLNAYKLISNKNKYYDIKEEEEEEDDKDKKKKESYILELIEQILLENENNNCKMSIEYCDKKLNNFNQRFFDIYLNITHQISKCHGLLDLKITFKVFLKMAVRSGNVELSISECNLNYQNDKQNVKINPNITFLLVNNKLGNYSVTYCTCGDCMNCKNMKEEKPFDDVLSYLKKKNKIDKKLQFTQLYFGKFNKYRNESGFKCSFCKDFYNKQSNIVKLFCNPDYDHTCQFWTCENCYYKNKGNKKNEKCPNCGKFMINFSKLLRIFTYLRWKKTHYFDIPTQISFI